MESVSTHRLDGLRCAYAAIKLAQQGRIDLDEGRLRPAVRPGARLSVSMSHAF